MLLNNKTTFPPRLRTCLKYQLLKEGFGFIYLADTFIQKKRLAFKLYMF